MPNWESRMHFIRPPVAFSLALALAACAKADEHPADTTAIATTSTDSTSTTTTAPLTTTPSTPGSSPKSRTSKDAGEVGDQAAGIAPRLFAATVDGSKSG
jgi:hypothetical protein